MGADSTVRSVSRSLELLSVFTASDAELGVSEVARRSGIGKSTAHRLLQTLVAADVVVQSPNGRYRLGTKLWDLGNRVVAGSPLVAQARPHLVELHRRLDEVVVLGVVEHRHLCVLDLRCAEGAWWKLKTVGMRLPVVDTATGLVIVAHLDDEAQRHHLAEHADDPEVRVLLQQARNDGALQLFDRPQAGLGMLAVAVNGPDGSAVASFGVCAPAARFDASWAAVATHEQQRASKALTEQLVASGSSNSPALTG